MGRPTQAVIHLDALRHNLGRAREFAPNAQIMAAVKANGYGHGLVRIVQALSGADAFGVATPDEAQVLRKAGIRRSVVLLEGIYSREDLNRARSLELELVVHHRFQVEALEADSGTPLSVWLKLDTGMHRLGVAAHEAAELHQRLCDCPQVKQPVRLMSHLACAEEQDNFFTRRQREQFDALTSEWPGERSLANSAGILHWPETHYDWVRPGGLLYGMLTVNDQSGAHYGLRPAMTLESRLIAVNQLSRGETVGYGCTWTAPESMPVGVVAIGYGDGYPRHADSGTPIVVNGTRSQTLGRVSMDMVAVDLRPLNDPKVGDRVVLWGEDLPVEEVAAACGTISYDLTSGLTARVPRVTLAGKPL